MFETSKYIMMRVQQAWPPKPSPASVLCLQHTVARTRVASSQQTAGIDAVSALMLCVSV